MTELTTQTPVSPAPAVTTAIDPAIIGKIVVIVPHFTCWTGTRAMSESDYQIGTNGKLPPKEVTKSFGLKAIIDTEHLRVFSRIKCAAEAILDGCGVRFLSGWAIPETQCVEVFHELDTYVSEYNQAKEKFVADYDRLIDEWVAKNPEFASEILASKLNKQSVVSRISAGYESFKLQPSSDEKTQELANTVSGLSDELITSVSTLARSFYKSSFIGKDRASKKTITAVKKIRDRLEGLSFLSAKINPVIALINTVLSKLPASGYFGGENFWQLATLVKNLGDESFLHEIMSGQLTDDLSPTASALDVASSLVDCEAPAPEIDLFSGNTKEISLGSEIGEVDKVSVEPTDSAETLTMPDSEAVSCPVLSPAMNDGFYF